MKQIELSQGVVAIVDDVLYDALSAHKWCAKKSNNKIYAVRTRKKGEVGPKTIRMHRVVLGAPNAVMVDHINGDTLDNRSENLRAATNSQNQQNKRTPKHNTSGYRGVVWHAKIKKWMAQISANGIHYHLGYFSDPKKAHEAYLKKARDLHGEFFYARTCAA